MLDKIILPGQDLKINAKKYPNKHAVIFQDVHLTYSEFLSRVQRLAHGLMSLGIKKGDKVSILLLNCHQYMEIYYALALIGAVSVPIAFRLTSREIIYQVVYTDSTAMILGSEFLERIESNLADLSRLTKKRIVILGKIVPDNMTSYDALLEDSPDTEVPEIPISPEDPFYIGYTSGTTGSPKGVVKTYGGMALAFLYRSVEYGLCQNDTYLAVGSLHHAGPQATCLTHIYIGGAVSISKQFEPEEVLRRIERDRITNLFMVPTMLNLVVNCENIAHYDTSSLRIILCSGAPLPSVIKKRVLDRFGNVLHEYYGSTESAVSINIRPRDQTRKIRSVGLPIFGTEIRLLDEKGQNVKRGEIGEIYIRSSTLFKEYYKNPEATQEAFRGDWFTAGDLGRQDEEGYYYIVDRKRDMIITGGENVYPAEVEEILSAHHKILEVAVIGIPDELWGEMVTAIVVLKDKEKATEKEIIDYCRPLLAGYKCPKKIEFGKQLPKTSSGKILKRVIREKYWENEESKL